MTTFSLNLPVDIPWKLLTASPDMMDTTFCDKSFPYVWRSSLAISAFEPQLSDLPDGLCDQRITYLKITCSITGYQPSAAETKQGYVEFGNVPTDVLDSLLAEYYGCYGALLNVAVFPSTQNIPAGPLVRTTVDFAQLQPGQNLNNPYQYQQLTFEAVAQASVTTVQRVPAGAGGGNTELDIGNQLKISLPLCSHVEVRVAPFAAPITMSAYEGTSLAGTAVTTGAAGDVSVLSADGAQIDTVVLTAPQDDGSLLTVTYVTRQPRLVTLDDYPHVIDFEPTTRDLYQAATESGEVLTASNSQASTGKSWTHTSSTQTGLDLKATYGVSATDPDTGAKYDASVSGGMTQKWGSTDRDSTQINAESSRDRREIEGTTTNISQLYNILAGYHAGTNRASFLMLPRPHILQATDYRTFINGLRIIEGVQEFMLIVSRPVEMPGMCVEAFLETGHFPENVTITTPPPVYDTSHEDFEVTAHAPGGNISSQSAQIEKDPSATHNIQSGWVIDRSQGDPGHSGISEIANNSNATANKNISNYNYQPQSDSQVLVSGTIWSDGAWGSGAIFDRTYRVFTRSEQPIQPTGGGNVTTPCFVTSRGLCVCIQSTNDGCVQVISSSTPGGGGGGEADTTGGSIVYEPILKISPALLAADVQRKSRLPAMKDLLTKMQRVMTVSWRQPSRRPLGAVGFLESDFFLTAVGASLPPNAMLTRLGDLEAAPEAVVQRLGADRTVADVGRRGVHELAAQLEVSLQEAATMRRTLMAAVTQSAARSG